MFKSSLDWRPIRHTHDDADKEGGVRGFGTELAFEELWHESGKYGEKKSFRCLIESEAHEGNVANQLTNVLSDGGENPANAGPSVQRIFYGFFGSFLGGNAFVDAEFPNSFPSGKFGRKGEEDQAGEEGF